MTREQQIDYVITNYLQIPIKPMATHIGRSQQFVRDVMRRESLVVPEHIKAKFIQDARFKPEHKPFNKGKKISDYLSQDSIIKIQNTQFKKGSTPPNTKEEGFISIRNSKGSDYAMIKINGSFQYIHRLIWERTHGPIKKGQNIQFKDGNTLNCDIDNLYLINRSDQSRINRIGGKSIPFPFHETIHTLKLLNKSINEKQSKRPK